jgi:aryl-alcohol dehydrogenase-like predicted oxidoreductase
VHPITAIQVEYSLFTRDIEKPQVGLLSLARELGIAIVPYCPLGRGMLTGQIHSPDVFAPGDIRYNLPRFSKENFHQNFELVEQVETLAKKTDCTPGQFSLAWLFHQWDMIFPIPGYVYHFKGDRIRRR